MWPDHLKFNTYNLLHLIIQDGLFLNNLGKIHLIFEDTICYRYFKISYYLMSHKK